MEVEKLFTCCSPQITYRTCVYIFWDEKRM